MRRIFLAVFALAICSCIASAQQPDSAPMPKDSVPQTTAATIPIADQPTKEQLFQLFDIMRIRSQMGTMLKMMPAAIQQQLKSEEQTLQANLPAAEKPTPAQQAALDKITAKYMDAAFTLYPIDELLNDMVGVYRRHLTREDVDSITAFYRSPAGQHLLENQPTMMKEIMPVTMAKMEERTKTLTENYSRDLKKAMDTPAAAPSK